ncbi:MAG: pyruvate ferredoxin oxidoreductase subunit gamma [Euryarchaeota archaeon]|nr:pyruvate ferredoxin oxidoreductase subunit gamma [Euryarchaeota archaeon]
MKEIRFHGRGGQGAVTAADLLAMAAFYEGRYAQSFPSFGTERRGAPVLAFARISNSFIRRRCQIYSPDYVVVLDPSLIEVVDVAAGIRRDGSILVNSEKSPEELGLNTQARVYTINATKIALDELGVPIVNTAMIGAFGAMSGEVSLEAIVKAVKSRFSGTLAEKNVRAVEVAFARMEERL